LVEPDAVVARQFLEEEERLYVQLVRVGVCGLTVFLDVRAQGESARRRLVEFEHLLELRNAFRQLANVGAPLHLGALLKDFQHHARRQADQDGDDGNDHQHLDQREAPPRALPVLEFHESRPLRNL